MNNQKSQIFDYLQIGLASPSRIRSWSRGEVKKPETINYRTLKPERDGLFCERIFGPSKDWECHCGKYKRVRHKGVVCQRCGVEVTDSKVRRERMGHIDLSAPVTHIWYLKGATSYISLLLGMAARSIEEVVYFNSYSVLDPGSSDFKKGQLLSEKEYEDYLATIQEGTHTPIRVGMGAEAVKELLETLDLRKLSEELHQELKESSKQKRAKIVRRLRIVEGFISSGNNPGWMVMEVIPVIPPDLRPMVQLDGGRFATSDLNDLYRRVINRNNRLKRLKEIHAPNIIIRNEMRMLQEAVDALISNGKRGKAVVGANNRPLKSLSNIIEGKQGRFRQNLLGKRVDYSGRSVIVVGPSLKLNQCGLPKEMALELFKPFVIHNLVSKGVVQNIKSAKAMIDRNDSRIWDALAEEIKGRYVLLNRAPTLHRLGIQAFEPILVEGRAIKLHPLVCTAFNADFDGDQMAVHVPLSVEAQTEAQIIMAANHNILAPSNGRPIVTPSQDMVLGIYYLTVENPKAKKGAGMIFGNAAEVITAYEAGVVDLHATIKVRRNGEKIDTTAGRVLFNQVMPESFAYVNYIVDKKRLEELLYRCYLTLGTEASALFADQLKELGFKFATQAGVSISIEDLHVPQAKKSILNRAESEIEQARHHYLRGEITEVERYSKVIDTWAEVTEELTGYIVRDYDRLNSVYMMAFSGARGNLSQVRQLVGMRGLMADPSGRIIDMPIKSNFKEGLNVTEYIISTYGARKGIVDTALRTADSGYLTRRLVDVAQDVIVWEEDCGTTEGIELSNVREGERIIVHVADQARGRVLMENVVDTATGEVVAPAGSIVDVPLTQKIVKLGTESLKIRSVLSCRSKFGVCRQCYGWNLSNNRLVDIGEAVGIIAAQSIGEPGTQLTMRTFHTGGVFSQTSSKVSIKAKKGGTVKLPKDMITKEFRTKHGATVRTLEKGVQMSITADDNTTEKYNVPANFQLKVANGDKVKEGTILAESLQEVGKGARKSTEKGFKDLLADFSGEVRYMGFAGNLVTDRQGNMAKTADRSGVIWILAGDIYPVIPDAKLLVKSDQEVKKGSLLAESEIACRFGGKVRFTQDIRTAEEKLSSKEKMNRLLTGKELYVEVSKLLNINGKLEIGKKASLLKVEGDKTYQLKVGHGTKVEHGMVLADAVDDSLVLHESGEIFIDNPSAVAKDRTVNEEVFLSFAPVESYSVNKDVSLLRAEHGTLVKAGQEIAKDVHSRIDGVLEVVVENYIIKEAKVWPVLEQYQVEKGENILVKNGQRIKEGTKLAGKMSSKKAGIVKVLPLGEEKGTLVLVRPVIAYSVKQEEPALKWKSSGIVFGVTARTHLLIDHGKHINTTTGGVPLARTEMILNLPGRLSDLLGQVEFVEGKDNKRSFQMVLLESVSLAKNVGLIRKALKEESESFATYLMVDAGDDVKANAVLAKSVVRSHSEGIADVSLDEDGHLKKLIVISPQMVSRFKWTKGEPAIKDGEIVREGTEVLPGVVTEEGGLVHIDAKAKTLSIRHGRPYLIKAGTHLMADEGQMVQQGEVVATLTFDKLKTGDIIQGLPRVEELLEARTPKEHAILSEHEGRVQVVQEGEIILKLSITDDKDVEHEYKVMPRVTLLVTNGQRVTRGDALTDGVLNPHDILRITGVSAVQQYLVNEVQQVYRSQGVHINNKHVELIVRQMTKKGIVIDPGEVTFLPGELVELRDVETLTESVPEEKKPLIAPALLGITKASLMTSSFISAASFQETTRVLTEAAIEGKKDYLRGLKENVIIGRLIPAGTGLATVYAEKTIEEVAGEAAAEVEAAGAEEAALARVGDGEVS